jgi:hypothetical protein
LAENKSPEPPLFSPSDVISAVSLTSEEAAQIDREAAQIIDIPDTSSESEVDVLA